MGKPKIAVLSFIAFQVVSALLGTDVFYFFALIYGIAYLYFYNSNDLFTKVQNYLSYPFMAVFCVFNFSAILSGHLFTIDSFDLRLLLMPVFMLITVAAAYRATRWWKVDSNDVVLAMCAGLLIGIPVLILFRDLSFDFSSFLGEARNAGMLEYNTNLADDVYAFVALVALLGASCLGRSNKSQRMIFAALVVPILASFAYALWFLIQGQSRGAWIAILSAVFIVAALRLKSGRPVPLSKAALALVAIVLIAKSDVILVRAGEEPISTSATLGSLLSPGYASAAPVDQALFAAQSHGELSSTEIRMLIWRDALHLMTIDPWRGFSGRDVDQIAKYSLTPQLTLSFTHFHNLFLDVGVRFGIILMLYYVLTFAFFIIALCWAVLSVAGRSKSALNGLLYISLAYFIYLGAENMFDVNLHQKEITSIVIAFCAIAGVALGLVQSSDDLGSEDVAIAA